MIRNMDFSVTFPEDIRDLYNLVAKEAACSGKTERKMLVPGCRAGPGMVYRILVMECSLALTLSRVAGHTVQ